MDVVDVVRIFAANIMLLLFASSSYGSIRQVVTGEAPAWILAVMVIFDICIINYVQRIIKALIPEYKAIGYTALAEIFIICAVAAHVCEIRYVPI